MTKRKNSDTEPAPRKRSTSTAKRKTQESQIVPPPAKKRRFSARNIIVYGFGGLFLLIAIAQGGREPKTATPTPEVAQVAAIDGAAATQTIDAQIAAAVNQTIDAGAAQAAQQPTEANESDPLTLTAARAIRRTEARGTANVRFTELAATRGSNPTSTPRPTEIETQTLYAVGNANLRPCPRTTADCAVAGTVSGGAALTVLGQEDGATVSGSAIWYKVLHNSQELYIHSSLVSATRPAAQPTRPPQQGNTSGGSQNASTVPPPPTSPAIAPPPSTQWNCNGNIYNCPDFTDRNTLMSYFNACPGDPSRLDGNNDGVPCEDLR